MLILDVDPELVWHKKVPLKIYVFAWGVLQNRLPTKDNFVRWGILQADDHFCIVCCGEMESINHLFLHCIFFLFSLVFGLWLVGIFFS